MASNDPSLLRLFLVRHAKSSWSDDSLDDHDRPLSARGERAASLLGAHLAQHPSPPSLALCSSALRAVQTLDRIAALLPAPPAQRIESALYHADTQAALECISRLGDGHACLLVLGHNPTTEILAEQLAGGGDRDALRRLRRKFPTAGVAELEIDAPDWASARPGCGSLVSFRIPRDLV